MRGLTSLFGMGRGEHPRQNHHKILRLFRLIIYILGIVVFRYQNKIKAYGQLVLLGFDVTTFTPVAYQRRSLRRPLKVNSS